MEMNSLTEDHKSDTAENNEGSSRSWFSCCNPNNGENTSEDLLIPEETFETEIEVDEDPNAFKMKIEVLERKVEDAEETINTLTKEKSEAEERNKTLTKEVKTAEERAEAETAEYKSKVETLESKVTKLKEKLSKKE